MRKTRLPRSNNLISILLGLKQARDHHIGLVGYLLATDVWAALGDGHTLGAALSTVRGGLVLLGLLLVPAGGAVAVLAWRWVRGAVDCDARVDADGLELATRRGRKGRGRGRDQRRPVRVPWDDVQLAIVGHARRSEAFQEDVARRVLDLYLLREVGGLPRLLGIPNDPAAAALLPRAGAKWRRPVA